MKKLISEVISMIEKQMKKNSTYLLKIEDFDDPVVYMEICRHFAGRHEINFIANLEYSKYQSFCECNNPDWNFALDYLSSNGYVQDIPLTKFRNLDKTRLALYISGLFRNWRECFVGGWHLLSLMLNSAISRMSLLA